MVQICSHMACHFISVSLVPKSLFHLFIALYGSVMFFFYEFSIEKFCGPCLTDFVMESRFWLFLNVFVVLESINLLHSSGNANIILSKLISFHWRTNLSLNWSSVRSFKSLFKISETYTNFLLMSESLCSSFL